VYLLRCADDSLYCGWTEDVERRLRAHRAGTASRYTRSRLPVELAAVLAVADRPAALREEARIKQLSRTEKLRLIERSAQAGPSRADGAGRLPLGGDPP
jgi:putative endonuclease